MSAATFSPDLMLEIADQESTHPTIRLLMIACERADRNGAAVFEGGELADLMQYGERRMAGVLRASVALGHLRKGSRVTALHLDISKVKPEGFPEVGAVYGELTLVSRVKGEVWLCKCSCGSRRTYHIDWLAAGITNRCPESAMHQQAAS